MARLEWAKAVNRKYPDTGKNWIPKVNDRICSDHFPDKQPTVDYPNPSVNLSSGPAQNLQKPKKARAPPKIRKPLKKKPKLESISSEKKWNPLMHHSHYAVMCKCVAHCFCAEQATSQKTIQQLRHNFEELIEKSDSNARAIYTTKTTDKTLKYLKTDKKVKIYTGLQSKSAFNDLHCLTAKKASRLRYWHGQQRTKSVRRNFTRTPVKSGPKRKLMMKEELLMVLMKLRLCLINQVLGDMFGVSAS